MITRAAASRKRCSITPPGPGLVQFLAGAGGVGGLLLWIRDDGDYITRFQYVYDANGNVGQVLDSSGTIVAGYKYDPFGKTLIA
jgi:hypothetical protein